MVAGVVLVTGASGFIGVELVKHLEASGYRVISATRNAGRSDAESRRLPAPDEPVAAFERLLENVDDVVHLAAIAHTQLVDATHTYHAVNCVLAAKLAQAAHKNISGKFVFVSSIRAQCANVHEGVALESDLPRPTDDYGRSKLAAEAEIAAAMSRGNYTILRPVLVYGAGVKGNMAMLAKLAALPVPLPLKSLTGRRSLLDRAALCRAIIHGLDEPKTDRGTFIVSDRNPVTVPQMLAAMRRRRGRNPGLFSCPPWIVNIAARITGQSDRWKTLNGDLIASSAKLQSTGWKAVDDPAGHIAELS
ncbi:UDP-glucose 4-epimerase [Phyllobacterium sp. 1468]|uniref:NAD-dependent epimerase/dehydratase family protein n=1 Tax=Phyllobacterium sp. 1468 TaxID=2817759 RepID=UPI0028625F9B|nr:NAD-dependent epimerase/dehydratase family protein [Phyllobacterium sp. 1468]MDR6633534.1 UDP-glucose 4-epimerase [Phyllobacterium sp. 1468]